MQQGSQENEWYVTSKHALWLLSKKMALTSLLDLHFQNRDISWREVEVQ
jgi:hypothetical protein